MRVTTFVHSRFDREHAVVVAPLDHSASGYSLEQAYWMAQAAALAYKEPDVVEQQAREWGFDEVRHLKSTHAMPFPIEDTQAYVAVSDRMIVVAFRGTEPAQIRDWLTDGTTPPSPGPGGKGFVHYGFDRALSSVYPQLRDTLAELDGDGRTVWFTGHSLGGALAMLAGARLYFEDPRRLPDGVYTFGQPRTCERLLAAAHRTAFKDRYHRFVNHDDIVPELPPEPAFTHVDRLRWFDADGRLTERSAGVAGLDGLTGRAASMVGDPFGSATDRVKDHSVTRYIAAIEKNLTPANSRA